MMVRGTRTMVVGKTKLNDALSYFNKSKKLGPVDGFIALFIKDTELYIEYGGISINLEQFWKARNAGKSIEETAFETFSGKWAKENDLTKLRYDDNEITPNQVLVIFTKAVFNQ